MVFMNNYPHKELTKAVIGAAIEVCLADELQSRGVRLERQCEVPVEYKESLLECGYRIDLPVENKVVAELKSVEEIQPIHESQLLTYLRLTGKLVDLLINFNAPRLRDGIVRKILSSSSFATSASLR